MSVLEIVLYSGIAIGVLIYGIHLFRPKKKKKENTEESDDKE